MERAVINFDKDQKEAYLADWNVAVSAGAGSGKTTVLSERYVRLINPGERNLNTNEVLSLTFTRKAAAEMYARIFKRLSAHPQAKERLAQFDQARISTLDSFCTTISRGVSYCYGISGDFKIDDKKSRRIAEETAAQVLMQHRHEDFLHRLVAARSFEVLVRDLFADIALSVFSFVTPGNYAVQAQDQITCSTFNE
jgi:ATP-dependent helicase/nuclease subunit A